AAALFRDEALLAAVNGGDAYGRMAKRFYRATLPPGAGSLPDATFKKRYPGHRERMKIFSLATIYNVTPRGLSAVLGITTVQAAAERDRFLAMFPALAAGLREACGVGRSGGSRTPSRACVAGGA